MLVQKIHPDGHVNHGARSAQGAQARWHAEGGGVQLLVETGHVCLHRFAQLVFRARVEIRQCTDGRPAAEAICCGVITCGNNSSGGT